MRKLLAFALITLAVCSRGAQTPSQVLASASAWQQLSDRDLRIASSYLLLQLAGLSTTPTATMSNAASWQALSDHDLLIAQAYLLTQVTSGGATNLTPWTTDINAAGFSLTNVGSIGATQLIITGGPNWVGQTYMTNGLTATNTDSTKVPMTIGMNGSSTNSARSVPWDIGAYEYQSPATFLGGTGSGGGGTFGSWRTQ
jgi:hypothetical protein